MRAFVFLGLCALLHVGCIFELDDVKPTGSATSSAGATGGGGGGASGPGAATSVGAGGGAPCSFPKICALHDDFDDGVVAPVWAVFINANPPCTASETNGELVIGLAKNQKNTSYCGYVTKDGWNMTEGTISIRVGETSSAAPGAETLLKLIDPAQQTIELDVILGRLIFSGPSGNYLDTPYDPNEDRWWRLSESAGMLSFSTSTDGIDWASPRKVIATPFALDAVTITIAAGTFDAVASPGAAHFDCLNVPGTCP